MYPLCMGVIRTLSSIKRPLQDSERGTRSGDVTVEEMQVGTFSSGEYV